MGQRQPGDWERMGTIIRRLKAENGRYVPGPSLLAESGLTRAAAWKYIERLRQWGYGIIASPRRGYCLTRTPDIPFPWEVEPFLTTRRLGRPLLYYDTLSSTNREAGHLAEVGAPEGLVVVTDYQTEGRGRLERSWHSPPGRNLLFSLLLRPEGPLDNATSLPLLLALALRRTLQTLTPSLNPMVKWPNDLLVDGRKIAGILCEMQAEPDRIRYLIAGLGLNVNMTRREFPPDLRITASSLRLLTNRPLSRPSLLAAFLNTFETFYDQWRHDGFSPYLEEYRRCDALAGRPVRIQQNDRILEGWADGIEPDGALRLRQADATTVHVHSGDAHVIAQSSKQREKPCVSLPSPSLPC